MCKRVRAQEELSSFIPSYINRSRPSRYSGGDGATVLFSARFIIRLIIEPERKNHFPHLNLFLLHVSSRYRYPFLAIICYQAAVLAVIRTLKKESTGGS